MHSGDLAGLRIPAPITLFELRQYDAANPNAVFYFTNDYGVTFNTVFYQPLGAVIEAIAMQAEGAIGVATVRLNDVQGIFSSMYRQYRLDNSELKVFKTDERYLNQTNSNKIRNPATFIVSHAEDVKPKESMSLILIPSIMNLDRPHGRKLTAYCSADRYKDGVTCPYTGSLPTCSKTLSGANGCTSHFPAATPKPFMGLPIGYSVEQGKGWGR
ncbi:MAG: hypothetical protein ACRC62_15300 [Microcoleus sp.]